MQVPNQAAGNILRGKDIDKAIKKLFDPCNSHFIINQFSESKRLTKDAM
jgi:hypothetical protein